MSQWDKLVAEILKEDPNLRFEDLYKALVKIGYTAEQPRGGSSHYTFRLYAHHAAKAHTHEKSVYQFGG